MHKALKVTGIVVAVLVGLVAVLAVTAKILITPERVKKAVLPFAEKKLHRQLQLGEIKVSIFSGIILRDVVVMEKDGKEAFLTAHEAKLRYQFWPLLSRQVVVDEVALDALKLRVVRQPDGTFNFSDMTAKKEAPEAPKPPEKGEINLVISKLSLTGGNVRYEDRGVPSGPPIVYTVSDLDVSANAISLTEPFPFTVKGKIPGTAIEMKGDLAGISTKPSIKGVIRVPQCNLGTLVTALPPELAAKAKAFAPSGSASAEIRVDGPVSAPKELLKDGEVKLTDVVVHVSGQRPTIAGTLKLNGDALSTQDLSVTLGPNKLKIALRVAHLLAKPIALSSAVTADTFSLDPFLGKPAAEKAPAEGGAKPEPGPLNLPLDATGTVNIGQSAYKGLPVTQLYMKYHLASNVLTISELRGNVANGSFSDSASIDLGRKGFAYATHLALRGVRAEPVVKAFSPKAGGTVSGALSMNAQLKGQGVQPAAMKNNLAGQGDFNVTGGRLTGTALLLELSRILNLPQLREINFTTFTGTFRIQGGKVLLESDIASQDLQITPKGTVGMDQSLDLALPTRLSPALTAKVARGQVAHYVTDAKGWGMVPLKASGTVSAPKVRIDTSAIGEELKSTAKQKLQQTIQEKLLKKKPGEQQTPAQELLQKGLHGIFGQ